MSRKPLEQDLHNILSEIKNKNIEGDRIIAVWNQIPESFIGHSKPSILKNKVLYIEADDSDWMYLCSLNIEKIRASLEEFFKQGIIKEIKFKVGR